MHAHTCLVLCIYNNSTFYVIISYVYFTEVIKRVIYSNNSLVEQ